MNESGLTKIFSTHRIVSGSIILSEPETGESKDYSFLYMGDLAGTQELVAALGGASIDERVISVWIKKN